MKNYKRFAFVILILVSLTVAAQPKSNYYENATMVGFPSLLKNIATYEKVKNGFTFFNCNEAQYNGLFYKSYVHESGATKTASFDKMELIFTRPFVMQWTQFPGFQITLNPLLKKGFYSKHYFSVTKMNDKTTSFFQTEAIGFKFPKGLLTSLKEKDSTDLLLKTTFGIEHDSTAGIATKDIIGFEMTPFKINGTPIVATNLKNAALNFAVKKDFDIIFESNDLANFIYDYNKLGLGKKPNEYYSALQFSGIEATIMMNNNNYIGQLAELYFSQNLVAGVMEIKVKNEAKFANDIAFFMNNKPNPNIKPNFKSVKGLYGNMYYWIKQDYKSVRFYFFMLY